MFNNISLTQEDKKHKNAKLEDKPVQSIAKTLDKSIQTDTWAVCQTVVSLYQTGFLPSFTVFHPVMSVYIYFNLLSKTGMGKLFITIADESMYFAHLLPLVKALKWGCNLSAILMSSVVTIGGMSSSTPLWQYQKNIMLIFLI